MLMNVFLGGSFLIYPSITSLLFRTLDCKLYEDGQVSQIAVHESKMCVLVHALYYIRNVSVCVERKCVCCKSTLVMLGSS